MEKPLLKLLAGQGLVEGRRPLWLMRQAGRYLPDYMDLRAEEPDFLRFCLNPALAVQASLLPLKRYDLDAAIMFADILLVPYGLGQKLGFSSQGGPQLGERERLSWDRGRVAPVYETIAALRSKLDDAVALIGFGGGLFTLACYMVEGAARAGFPAMMRVLRDERDRLVSLMDLLLEASVDYLSAQIEAGAEVIQIFDSHAGLVEGQDFAQFVVEPTQRLVAALRQRFVDVPVIGFARGARAQDSVIYARDCGLSAVSLGQEMELFFVRDVLQPLCPIQGLLDPALLVQGGAALERGVRDLLAALDPARHIVNLGHGINKETPPAHVEQLVGLVRRYA
ncbi:MAG: uroporphyrinogen decarboxylase [Alphaproteobacteria bacterium]|nr:uroporphyrinogen decarboxylase [Alphaproteobacteria bacterium]